MVFPATNLVSSSEAAEKARNTDPSTTLYESMTPTAPTNMSALMMICSRPRWSTSETLSRSFVARLMMSPG